MNLSDEVKDIRKPTYDIQSYLVNRWSPRSMTGEPMADEELFPLFEAAGYAPSSFNSQPWRILYAKRDTPEWDLFFNLMVEANQKWTKNASCLLVFVSRDTFERNNKLSVTHSYDTGASWMALALEGAARGYVVHGMSGFNYEKAKADLEIPDGYTIEAMAAVGKRAPKENLAPEIAKMEAPSTRNPLSHYVINGKWNLPQ